MNDVSTLDVNRNQFQPPMVYAHDVTKDIEETNYCDFSHRLINEVAKQFSRYNEDPIEMVKRIFIFVRDTIVFGGDRWKVKASETLRKGYGACYNKNLLLTALLRYWGIPAKFCANPMRKDFCKAVMGFAYRTVSNPFYHCFTRVLIEKRWIDIDPTLDQGTYKIFFAPKGIDWGIEWDGVSDMLLYRGAVIGNSIIYDDLDRLLERNLDSYYLFKNEPEFLISLWLSLGNKTIWKKVNDACISKNGLKPPDT